MLLLLLLCLAGCGRKEAEPVEITFIHGWGSTEADHVAMRRIYSDFEKENPGIKLNMISMPSPNDVIRKVGDLLTVGEIPDIIFTAGDGRESIYEFMVEKQYALDLMPYIQADEKLRSCVSDVAMNYWITEEDRLYTVSDVLMLSGGYWYNKDLFREVGIKEPASDRDGWLEICERINAYGTGQGLKLKPIILDSDHVIYLMDAILADEYGDVFMNPENRAEGLGSNSLRHTLSELEQIMEESAVANAFSFRDTLASFNARETAMYVNGIWASSMIDESLNIAYMPFPTKDGKGISAVSSGVGYILGNTKDEAKIRASVEFLKYMLSEPVAQRILKETGQIPANPNIEITKEIAGERLYQAIQSVEQAGKKIEIPANIWGSSKKDEYGEGILLYLEGRLSLEELQSILPE